MARYWLTPPELEPLRTGRFDPTPYPHEFGDRNALLEPWPKPWYLNPPFSQVTRFVRRALEVGGPGIMVIPCPMAVYLCIEADLGLSTLGRVRWLDADTKKPMPNPPLCIRVDVR